MDKMIPIAVLDGRFPKAGRAKNREVGKAETPQA